MEEGGGNFSLCSSNSWSTTVLFTKPCHDNPLRGTLKLDHMSTNHKHGTMKLWNASHVGWFLSFFLSNFCQVVKCVDYFHKLLVNNPFVSFQVLGPKNVGLPLLIPLTLIYVLIFLSGVAGNVAVCLVIVKNKSMHTATNYYLFSLAVSDLMILVLGELMMSCPQNPGVRASGYLI